MRPHPDVVALLRSLLDVQDNLERALGSDGDGAHSAMAEGIRSIHRQLSDVFYRYDLRAFTSLGVPFDPNRHEAVGQMPRDDMPPMHVALEVSRGYVLGEALFRPARVLVSQSATPQISTTTPSTLSRPAALERSAPNRPAWLSRLPPAAEGTLQLVASTSGAASHEEGRVAAADAVLPMLLGRIATELPQERVAPAYAALAKSLGEPAWVGSWRRFITAFPWAAAWIEDYFWEAIRSEIRGRVFDAALLVVAKLSELQALLQGHGALEHWSGLSFVNRGPLLEALSGDASGALVVDAVPGSPGARAGLGPGDIVLKVGLRVTPDAASARRLLTLMANARRPIEVEHLRGLSEVRINRLDPPRGPGRT